MKSVGKCFSIVFVFFVLFMTDTIWFNNNDNSTIDAIAIKPIEDPIEVVDNEDILSQIEDDAEETKDNEQVSNTQTGSIQSSISIENKDIEKPVIVEKDKEEKIPVVKEEVKPELSEFRIMIVRQKLGFTTSYIEDSSINEGEKVVQTKGVDGLEIITYEREYKANKLISEKILSKSISQEAINEVILVGTKKVSSAKEFKSYALDSFNRQNEYRKSIGVAPLVWNESLYQSVLVRANELTIKFSHTRPNGASPFSVINISCNGAAENIAMKATTNSNVGQIFTEEWLNSSSHHDNLANLKYTKAAVAIVELNGIYFAVTMFVG